MSWESDFEKVHGRPPNAQDVADREWSETLGHSPSAAEWQSHYYQSQGNPAVAAPVAANLGGGNAGYGQGGGGYGQGGGVPYGGYNWMQQLQAIAQQLAALQQQYGTAVGWMQPAVEQVPTKASAFEAIFQSRPDLQAQKQDKYADWSVARYMQHWWEGSGEMHKGRNWTDPNTGRMYTNAKDVSPVEFAIARGYVSPGPNPSGTYGFEPLPGTEAGEPATGYPWERYAKPEREPTLAREEAEHAWELADKQYLRLIGLDEQQQENLIEEWKHRAEREIRQDELDDREWARLDKNDAEAVRQFNLDRQDRVNQLATQNEQWERQFEAETGFRADELALARAQHDLNVRAQEAQQAQFQMTHEERVHEFELTYGLDKAAAEQRAREFEQEFGLEERKFERGGIEWEREQTEKERYNRLQQQLEMMGLLGQQQGPRNWLQYGALQRGAGIGNVPEWQRRLQEGLGFAPFQGGAAMPAATEQHARGALPGPPIYGEGGPGLTIPTEGVQFGPQVAPGGNRFPIIPGVPNPNTQPGWQGNLMNQAMQYIQPQTISPQQWQNMMPSEKEMLMGQVETPQELGGWGGWAPDYLQRMQAAWPTGGQVQGISQWGGW